MPASATREKAVCAQSRVCLNRRLGPPGVDRKEIRHHLLKTNHKW